MLPANISAFVEDLCTTPSRNTTSSSLPHMIIPINSGDGRSYMTRLIASEYAKNKIRSFSSRDIFMEFSLDETVQRINEVDAELQSCAEYANEYQGLVALNADKLLHGLNDSVGKRFFELVTKIKAHSTVIIFVPAKCEEIHIDTIAKNMGMNTKRFPAIFYSANDYAKFFFDLLPQEMQPRKLAPSLAGFVKDYRFAEYKNQILSFLEGSIHAPTIKKIKECAEAVAYDPKAKAQIFGNPVKNTEGEVQGI